MAQFIYYVSLMVCVLVGCGVKQEINRSDKKYVVDMNTLKRYEMEDLFEQPAIAPLETSNEILLGRINKVVYNSGDIYFLDQSQNSIFTFNLDGEFVHKLKRVGRGEGEYLGITDFTINPYTNNIEMIDGKKLRIYDHCGEFVTQLDVLDKDISSVTRIEIVDSLTIAFISKFSEKEGLLYSREKGGFILKEEVFPQWARTKIPFGSFRSLSRDDVVHYFQAYSNKVYSIDAGGYHLEYEWDFGKNNFDYENPPLLDEVKGYSSWKEAKGNEEYYMSKYIVQFQNGLENSSHILTNFLYRGKPSTIIFNKMNGKYVLFDGQLSNLLFFNKAFFVEDNTIVVVVDTRSLKTKPTDWFSDLDKTIVKNLSIEDNPVLLKLRLKSNVLE